MRKEFTKFILRLYKPTLCKHHIGGNIGNTSSSLKIIDIRRTHEIKTNLVKSKTHPFIVGDKVFVDLLQILFSLSV